MVAIEKIGEVLGLAVFDVDVVNPITARLRRIAEKLAVKPGESGFEDAVLAAEVAVDEAGGRALLQSFAQCSRIEEPAEREYKIKRVPKGERIKIVSASGVRFSFGPVWNDSVIACKGIAVNENNREKLNMHGTYLGVENPDALSPRELCAAIAARLS